MRARTRSGRVAIMAAVIVTVAAGSVGSASARRAVHGNLEAQLGLRFNVPGAALPVEGQTLEGQVVNPDKLRALGLAGLNRGDMVKLRSLPGERRFEVLVPRTGQKLGLLQDQRGTVKAAPLTAAP